MTGNGIQLTAIYIANGMAMFLALQLLLDNDWHFYRSSKEMGILRLLIIASTVACAIDPLVFWADGREGLFYWLIVYIGNMLLFIDNIVVGVGWLAMVCIHLLGTIPKYQRVLMAVLGGIGLLMVAVNLFVPVVFSVDAGSVYERQPLFWLYTLIEGICMLDGIAVYLYARKKGGSLKYFPVLQFIIPAVTGILIQSAVYGVSLIYPMAIISAVGIFNGFRNEALHMDSLTGLYNRTYLDIVNHAGSRKGRRLSLTALMLDVNGFKTVNDRFGHAEGDVALMRTAAILRKTVGALGCVVRYAGDEFVVLLNTENEKEVTRCIRAIHAAFEEENRESAKEYSLSVSIGSCATGQEKSSLDDILSNADRMMYQAKRQYYSEHGRDRRAPR